MKLQDGALTHESYPEGDPETTLLVEDVVDGSIYVGEHHCLNREEVAELIGYLQRWLETGKLCDSTSR